jgi:hypothetical protein
MWPLVTISWPAMSVNSHNDATSAENVGRAPEPAQLVQDSALMAVADRAARHRRGGRRAATATRPSRPDSHARSRLAAQDTRNHCSPRRAQGETHSAGAAVRRATTAVNSSSIAGSRGGAGGRRGAASRSGWRAGWRPAAGAHAAKRNDAAQLCIAFTGAGGKLPVRLGTCREEGARIRCAAMRTSGNCP